jgi:hypothetical protein
MRGVTLNKHLLLAAKCVGKQGYPNFPDPDSQGSFDLHSGSFDPKTPQFQSAMKACRGKTPLRVGFRVGR